MIHSADFREWIDVQPTLLGDEWLAGLEDRKQAEADFHDSDRAGHRDEQPDSTPNRRFYEAATVVSAFIDDWIAEHAPGRVFLDYACGNGVCAIAAANAGAELAVGIDISAVSVNNAAESAKGEGVGAVTRFLQRDCESTTLPAGSIDVCLCSGMLHHLDLNLAFPELFRILAPGGRILAVEALAYNPVIRWYRRRSPELRTEWEAQHILSLREVSLARRWFEIGTIRYFLMAAPLATLLPRGPLRIVGLRAGHLADAVLTRVPFLNRLSWQFTFELIKPRG
ncbi:MAG TPA: class I SAM-dependent methyltransferase [Gemmatimonadaceae bacterium]|nr:class I SAM-dependent methyltransferase [Gemmatimonadaceae bacterium]